MFGFGVSMLKKRFKLHIILLKQVCDGTGSNQTTTLAPQKVYLAVLFIVNWCILDVIQFKYVRQVGK